MPKQEECPTVMMVEVHTRVQTIFTLNIYFHRTCTVFNVDSYQIFRVTLIYALLLRLGLTLIMTCNYSRPTSQDWDTKSSINIEKINQKEVLHVYTKGTWTFKPALRITHTLPLNV